MWRGFSKEHIGKCIKEETSKVCSSPPFLDKLVKYKENEKKKVEEYILEVFDKVKVNIPLLNMLKQIPGYAKLIKELCRAKRRLQGNRKIALNENVSSYS